MRIIQIIPFFGLGGAEIMCENLIYELIKQGHDVTVISMYTRKTPITERLERAKVDLRYLDKKAGFDFSMFRKIKKILREKRPHALHIHLYCVKYAVPAARALRVPKIVYTVHSIAQKDAGKMARVLNEFFFKVWDVVPVALSKLVRETVVEAYRLPPEKVPFIYNGVNLEKCVSKVSYEVEGEIKILHVGSFYQPKNHIGLVKAFRLVCEKQAACKLYLIGEGVERENIERYVFEHGLKDKVVFLGAQKDVFVYLKEMDIFTLPSNYEGIPLSLAEAMGTGLPIVATAVGGVPDMVTHEESALLTAVDEKEIAEALLRLVESKELRERLGKNALSRAEAFSAKIMAEKYLEIYGG